MEETASLASLDSCRVLMAQRQENGWSRRRLEWSTQTWVLSRQLGEQPRLRLPLPSPGMISFALLMR